MKQKEKLETNLKSFNDYILNHFTEIETQNIKELEDKYNTRIENQTKLINQLQNKNTELVKLSLKLTTENEKLTENKTKLNPDITKVEFLNAQLKAMNGSYAELVKELNHLKIEKEKLTGSNNYYVTNNKRLINKNNDQAKELYQIKNNKDLENEKLAEENEKLIAKNKKLTEINSKLTIFLNELGYNYIVKPKTPVEKPISNNKKSIDEIKDELAKKYNVVDLMKFIDNSLIDDLIKIDINDLNKIDSDVEFFSKLFGMKF